MQEIILFFFFFLLFVIFFFFMFQTHPELADSTASPSATVPRIVVQGLGI